MEKLLLTLSTSFITFSAREKRMLFDDIEGPPAPDAAEGEPEPAADEPAAPAGDPEKAYEGLQAKMKEYEGKTDGHTADFARKVQELKAHIDTKVKAEAVKEVAEDKKAEMLKTLGDLAEKAESLEKHDKALHSLNERGEKFKGKPDKTVVDTWVSATLGGTVEKLEPAQKAAVVAAVEANFSKIGEEIVAKIKAAELGKVDITADDASTLLTGQTATIDALLTEVPADFTALLTSPSKFPKANQSVLQSREYLAAVTMLFDKAKAAEFIDKDKIVAGGECAKAQEKFKSDIDAWLKNPKGLVSKGSALTKAVQEHQNAIILAHAFDKLNTPEYKEQADALRTALKVKPNEKLTLKHLKDLSQDYASGAFKGKADINAAAQAVLDVVSKEGIKVDVTIEGEADAQSVNISASNQELYEALDKAAKAIEADPTLQSDPTIAAHLANIKAYSAAPDKLAYLQGLDPAAKESLTGAGGALNTLLAYTRPQTMLNTGSLAKYTTDLGIGLNLQLTAHEKGVGKDKRRAGLSFAPQGAGTRALAGALNNAPVAPAAPVGPTSAPEVIQARSDFDKMLRGETLIEGKKLEDIQRSAQAEVARATALDDSLKTQPHKDLQLVVETLIGEVATAARVDVNAMTTEADIKRAIDTLRAKAKELRDKALELKGLNDGAERVPDPSVLNTTATLEFPTVNPGQKFMLGGHEFEFTGSGYVVDGEKHPLTQQEVKIIAGMERPDDAFIKSKTTVNYLKGDKGPQELNFDHSTDIVTAAYVEGGSRIEVSYNLQTGEKKVELKTGNLSDLLEPDETSPSGRKTFSKAAIEQALKDGLDIASLTVEYDDSEKALKEHLVKGEWRQALELLADGAPAEMGLIAQCVSKLEGNLGTVNRAKLDKLIPHLKLIVEGYNANILNFTTYNSLKVLNNGQDLSGDILSAFIDHKNFFTDTLIDLIQITANQSNDLVVEKYVTEAFDDTLAEAVNIAAIANFKGDLTKVSSDVYNYVFTNYQKFVDQGHEAKAKTVLETALKTTDVTGTDADYEAKFNKLLGSAYPIDTNGLLPQLGDEVWAKYMTAKGVTELMGTQVEQALPVGSVEAGKFVETMVVKYGLSIGTVDSTNLTAAKQILEALNKSVHPKVAILKEELIAAILAVPNNNLNEAPDAKQARIDALYAVAINPHAKPEERIPAILSFVEAGGIYAAETPRTAQSAANFKEALKGHLATIYYGQEKYGNIAPDYTRNLPEEQQKFVDAYIKVQGGTALDETEMKALLGNAEKIGAKALYTLANEAAMSESHKFRIYKAIGMPGKAEEILASITDAAEKAFFEAVLITDKKYKDMSPDEQKAVKEKLETAYKGITAGSTSETLQIEIAEQLFELSEHSDTMSRIAILQLLDSAAGSTNGFLNDLADKPLHAATGTGSLAPSQLSENDLWMRAKVMRAKIEKGQCDMDPSLSITDFCKPDELLKDITTYVEAKTANVQGYKLDKDLVDTIKSLYPDKDSVPATDRGTYSELMVRMAKESGDNTYITATKIDIADLTTDEAKAYVHTSKGEWLAAAMLTSDDPSTPADEKMVAMDLAEQFAVSPAEFTTLANEYEKILTSAAQLKALELYTTLGQFNKVKDLFVKSPSILSDGEIRAKLNELPADRGTLAIEVEVEKGWHAEALARFKANPTAAITIDALNAGIAGSAYSVDDVIDGIKAAERKVTGAQADLDAFYTTNVAPKIGSHVWSTTEEENIKKSLKQTP